MFRFPESENSPDQNASGIAPRPTKLAVSCGMNIAYSQGENGLAGQSCALMRGRKTPGIWSMPWRSNGAFRRFEHRSEDGESEA